MFFKRTPKTREICKKIRMLIRHKKGIPTWEKMSAWIGKKRHKLKSGKLKHAKKSQALHREPSLTTSSVTKSKIKSNICDGEQRSYHANFYEKDQIVFDKIHLQQDVTLLVSNEDISKAQCKMIDHLAMNLADIDSCNMRQSFEIPSIESTKQNLLHNIHTIQYQVWSEEKNNESNYRALPPCNDNGKLVKEMVDSLSDENENDFNLSNNIRPTECITRNEGAFAKDTHEIERQQTAWSRTISLVESDVDKSGFVNQSCETQESINIAPNFCANKNHWQNEPFLVISNELSFREDESEAKFKVFNDETLTQADIDNDNIGFSFEIELDALSLVQSDLDEDCSIDESCITEESSFINILPFFLFNAFLNAVSIFFNNDPQTIFDINSVKASEYHPTIDVDQYLDFDAKLSMALAFNRKKELVSKHRIISYTRRRNRVLGVLLFFSSVIFTYNFVGQWGGTECTDNITRTRSFARRYTPRQKNCPSTYTVRYHLGS